MLYVSLLKLSAMKTKLTLSIDAEVIQKAKLITGKRKQSLSFIVEDYLKSLFTKPAAEKKEKELTFTQAFRQKFPAQKKIMSDETMEKSRHEYLLKKHG
jgi:nitrogen fixation protein FixH